MNTLDNNFISVIFKQNFGPLFDHYSDAVFVKNTNQVYTYLNNAASKMIGKDPIEILGHTDEDIFDPTTAAIISSVSKKVLTTLETITERRVYNEAENKRHIHSTISPFFDQDNNVLGTIGICHDLTKFQDLETALREREALLSLIFEQSKDVIFKKDRRGKYVIINKAGADLIGRKVEDIIGKTDHEIFPGDLADDIVAMDRKAIRTKESYKHDEMFDSPEGPKWFELSITPCVSVVDENMVTGVLGVSRDITNRLKIEEKLRKSQENLSTVINNTQDCIYFKNLKGKYKYINPAGAKFVGKEYEDIGEHDDYEIFDEETAMLIKSIDDEVMATEKPYSKENIFGNKNNIKYFNSTVQPAFSKQGELVGVVGISRDVTDIRQTQDALWDVEKRYHDLYEETPAIFITLDIEGTIKEVNRYGAEYLGYEVKELKNKKIFEFVPKVDVHGIKAALKKIVQKPGQLFTHKRRFIRKDGEIIWVKDYSRVILDMDGTIRIPVLSEDVTQAHELHEELDYNKKYDPKTGLMTTEEFVANVQKVIDASKNNQCSNTLCMISIDQTKAILESCGHKQRDDLLKEVSSIVTNAMGKSALIGKTSNQSISVLLEKNRITELMPRFIALLNAIQTFVFKTDNKSFDVTASLGVVDIVNINNANEIIRMGQQAISLASDLGGNRIYVWDPDDTDLDRKKKEIQAISLISDALKENRFVLYKQLITPLLDKFSGNHYELLIRMIDEDGSIVAPNSFLPAAERHSMVDRIDKWVIDHAFSWLVSEGKSLGKNDDISINLSGQTVSNENMMDYIHDKIIQYDVPTNRVCFEITESSAMTNLSLSINHIKSLTDVGCKFSLDDFGSGLSSFMYLKNLPVNYLKIDGSFVKDILEDEVSEVFVKSITDVGHVMGLKIIGEYVENEEIQNKLKELNVDFAQGYAIHKPEPLL